MEPATASFLVRVTNNVAIHTTHVYDIPVNKGGLYPINKRLGHRHAATEFLAGNNYNPPEAGSRRARQQPPLASAPGAWCRFRAYF